MEFRLFLPEVAGQEALVERDLRLEPEVLEAVLLLMAERVCLGVRLQKRVLVEKTYKILIFVLTSGFNSRLNRFNRTW